MVYGVPPASSRDIRWTESLAAIGPLLCLYPVSEPDVLSALAIASRLRVSVRIDVHGPCECLNFFDDDWRPCWRIYRLPDSDRLSWDQLVAECLGEDDDETPDWPWRFGTAIERRLGNPLWRASPLLLHSSRTTAGAARLAASPARLSFAGNEAARHIARIAGAMLAA
ncbi:MAG: hypothetical protein KDI75_03675 [Xanthomonadales bacterium]|nr:hypothetical protein [Xanthomonadales bacterium]